MNKSNSLPPVLSPRLWGDTFWGVMHNLAAAVEHVNLPTKQKAKLKMHFAGFLCGIPFILPCLACRNNAPKFFSQRLANVNSNTDLDLLVCDLHNDVNEHLQKPAVSHETAKLRVSDLNLFRINTCQIWRFVVIVARSTDPAVLRAKNVRITFDCLAQLLSGLEHKDLAQAIKRILVPKCSMCKLFPIYKKWHNDHKLPCSKTLAEFLVEHKLDGLD